MFKKACRMAVCVLMFAIFITVLFPAGAGGADPNQSVMYMPPTTADTYVTYYVPDLEYQEPKMTLFVETDDNGQLIIRVSKNAEKEEIKKAIEEMVESILSKEKEDPEKKINWETIIGIRGIPEEEIEGFMDEDLTGIALHDKFVPGFLEGYLFCNVSEALYFDISDLFDRYQVISFEWATEGNGNYEHSSISPIFFHRYDKPGLYNMRIRMTYAYTYKYQYYIPWCGNDRYYSGKYIYPKITPYTYGLGQKDIEYEIQVSVGSAETGYPPIIKFNLETESGEIYFLEDDKGDGAQYSVLNKHTEIYSQPLLIEPDNIIPIPGNLSLIPWVPEITSPGEESDDISLDITSLLLSSEKHVSMSRVQREVKIPILTEHVITLNASETIHREENPQFLWAFGGGEYGSQEIVNHTYRRGGTYTVTLRLDRWGYTHSKTFSLLRGSEDPRRIMIGYSHQYEGEYQYENYVFCKVYTPFVFDATSMIGSLRLIKVEWDFEGDGVYELETETAEVTNTYTVPGYYEGRVRYTYSYDNLWNGMKGTRSYSVEKCIKVMVANEGGIFPPRPDFFVSAPRSQSWWNPSSIKKEEIPIPKLMDISFIRPSNPNDNFLNPFRSSATFNASTTVNLGDNELTYYWEFGDGSTGEGRLVNHTYYTWPNNKKVILTVNNGYFNTSIVKIMRRISSPNIYLYREMPCFDTIKVIVDGQVTKAIPEVPLGSEIEWEDVWVMGGKVFVKNKEHDFLYYEEEIDPVPSKYGWILERDRQGRLFLNDEPTSIPILKGLFSNELSKAGLFYNEIEDFIEEWLGDDGRLIPEKGVFRYAIMYVPENVVNDIIQIETEKEYDEILRVHFLVQPAGKGLKLNPPTYSRQKRGANILHEWGVYTSDSLITERGFEGYNPFFCINFPDQSDTPNQMNVARKSITASSFLLFTDI